MVLRPPRQGCVGKILGISWAAVRDLTETAWLAFVSGMTPQ